MREKHLGKRRAQTNRLQPEHQCGDKRHRVAHDVVPLEKTGSSRFKAHHIHRLSFCVHHGHLLLMFPQDSLQKEQFPPPQIFSGRYLLQAAGVGSCGLWPGSTSGLYSSIFMPVLWKWHLPIAFTGLWRRSIRQLTYPAFRNLPN